MIIYFILFIYLLWGKEKGTPSKGDSLTKLVSNDCVGEKKALWIQIGWEEIKKYMAHDALWVDGVILHSLDLFSLKNWAMYT